MLTNLQKEMLRGPLRWLCTPESMPSICLQYGLGVALGWLWVACRPSSFKVRRSMFDVRRSAPRRHLDPRKAACRPSAVSLAYIPRPDGGRRGPKLSPREPPMTARRLSHDSPVCLPRKAACRPSAVSLAYIPRPDGGRRGPKLSPREPPMTARRLSHDSPVCLP